MPYGYGSANKGSSGGSKGSPHGGGGGGGWSPGVGGKQHQPKKKTGGWSPGAGGKQHIPKKKTTWTPGGGAPTHIPKKKWTPGPSKWPSSFQQKHWLKKVRNQNKRLRLDKLSWKDYALSGVNPWQLDTLGDDRIHTTLGTRAFTKGLKDYMFGKGITSLQNLPPEAKLWMAHAPEPDDLAKLKKTGFKSTRPGGKGSLLLSPRSWEQALKGKNPLTSAGAYTAVGKTKEEALKAAAKFGKPWYSRGVGAPVDASKVLVGQVPRGTHPIHSGVTRISQMEVPSHVANKAFQIGDKGARVGAIPAKGMIKSTVGRMLPGVGAALGAASATKHLQAGNYGQAAMAGLSMVPGPVGWAGLGGELALGALQNAKQIPNWQATRKYANGGLIDLYRYGGFIG